VRSGAQRWEIALIARVVLHGFQPTTTMTRFWRAILPDDVLPRRPTSISSISSGELPMPVYEFKCKKCGHRFELTESISKHDKHREKCPECGSRSIQNIVSSVNVKTAKKS